MIAPAAQFLVVFGSSLSTKKEPKEQSLLIPSPYRTRCLICDSLGKDARLPCIGHDMAAD